MRYWAGHRNQVEYMKTEVIDFEPTRHSAALVPVFTYGPGAENFIGVYENTEIFHKLVSLMESE